MNSPWCEQFSKIGYCWHGPVCHKIHHLNGFPNPVQTDESVDVGTSPNVKNPVPMQKPASTEKTKESMNEKTESPSNVGRSRRVSDQSWIPAKEEFVRAKQQSTEFAAQQDFVPL